MPPSRFTPQEEENLVLKAAAECIEAKSLIAFTMSDISKASGLSMGSVYKHVQSKEDVLVALVAKSMKHMHAVFEEFFAKDLSAPEQMIGSVLWTPDKLYLHPFGVHMEMMVHNDAVLAKASPRWLDTIARIDLSMEALFVKAIEKAIDDGELTVASSERAKVTEELMVGVWSLYVGFVQVAYQRGSRAPHQDAIQLPFPLPLDHALVCAARRLINSYSWKVPLDDKSIERVSGVMTEMGYR
mgnify:CR=1 FL=1